MVLFIYAKISHPPTFFFVECHAAIVRIFFLRMSVQTLSYSIGPSAIFFTIIPIYVYSVQRESFWPFTHIFDKILKTVFPAPSVTNLYSDCAIIFVNWMVRVIAPLFSVIKGPPHFWMSRYISSSISVFFCFPSILILAIMLHAKTFANNFVAAPNDRTFSYHAESIFQLNIKRQL